MAKPQLLRFGLQHRTFEVVSRPTTTAGSNHLDGMAFLDGKLCYVHVAAKELASLHIWMANDDDEGLELEWSLLCRVDIPDPVYNLMFSDMVYRCWLYGGRIDGMAVDMQPDGSCDSTVHSLVPYFETLVSPM